MDRIQEDKKYITSVLIAPIVSLPYIVSTFCYLERRYLKHGEEKDRAYKCALEWTSADKDFVQVAARLARHSKPPNLITIYTFSSSAAAIFVYFPLPKQL